MAIMTKSTELWIVTATYALEKRGC